MASVEWGKKKVTDLFDVYNTHNILSCDVTGNSGTTPYLGAGDGNNSIISYISYNKVLIEEAPCIFIGGKTFVVTYQENDFFSNDSHNLVLYVKDARLQNKSCQLLLVSCIYKSLKNKYSWGNSISYKKIQDDKIVVPIKNNTIDFEFMESFIEELEAERIEELEAERIEELEAYLSVSGLKDTQLTADELSVVNDLISKNIEFKPFCYDVIFDKIVQGRRLKKDDQIAGDIPFVMAGVTNTGVVGYISNPVASFPKNSITIDIFGNAFYRNYDFGAGDDTGVYWSEKSDYSKEIMLFLTCSMGKSIENKFSYGKKLRSSQSFKFKMQLPVKNEQPDYELMSTLISAIQKLVIADVVKFSDENIKATKQVVG